MCAENNEMQLLLIHALAYGGSLCLKNSEGNNPLRHALLKNNWPFMKIIFQAACVPVKDVTGKEFSTERIQQHRFNSIIATEKVLVEHALVPQNRSLITASFLGDLSFVQWLHQQKHANLLYQSLKEGYQPIHYAALGGNVAVMEYLLNNGADINALVVVWKHTAAYIAASKNHVHVIRYLHNKGVDLNCPDYLTGLRPITQARRKNSLDVVRYLAELEMFDNRDKSHYSESVPSFLVPICTTLNFTLECKEKYNALICPEQSGYHFLKSIVPHNKELIQAAHNNQLVAVKKALKAGAELSARFERFGNNTAMHYAAAYGNYIMALVLLSHEVPSDKRVSLWNINNTHNRPLDCAIQNNQWQFIKVMLQAAYIKTTNSDGTPASKEIIKANRKACIDSLNSILPMPRQEHKIRLGAKNNYSRL